MTSNKELTNWIEAVRQLTRPDDLHWCDGSEAEYQQLIQLMLKTGDLLPLNEKTHPGCYLHRSDPSDVARTEHLTYVCSKNEIDAGPNNQWMAPADGHAKVDALFEGAMKGRTLYVIPYCMGPIDSPLARCGVELTDSPYVAASMYKMTRMGSAALKRIENGERFVKGLHSLGDLNPERRLIMHFPEELTIKSIGSGYGGNALLGKKCHALRIASWQSREEGWMAEHMMIVGIENPQGETRYIAAAFPSACGKTNMAMLIPPEIYKGYKVWTIGDDIAWLHAGEDGRLWAINPEAGFFGVAPGTSVKTNPNATAMVRRDTIFTNVALTKDNQPWWEGLPEAELSKDWRGDDYDPANGHAAHPNSRFTVSSKQCPSYSKKAEAPEGVPIDAIIFGGRRAELAPLVYQAKSWQHGVMVGASAASETTAAATGEVGIVRRDPMAMKPFCGYNYGDYWAHWLNMGKTATNPPKIFHVNWFRQGKGGKFLWPGFGENLRVLQWILGRCSGEAKATETPIGYLPEEGSIDTKGLDIDPATMSALASVDKQAWLTEMREIGDYLESFGERLPATLKSQHSEVMANLLSW